MAFHFYTIRHSTTDWNEQKRMMGQRDIPLSRKGIQLALSFRNRIAAILPSPVIYSSDLSRCQETSKLLFPDTPPELLPELRERNMGKFEGLSIDHISLKEYDYCRQYGSDNFESDNVFLKRVMAGLAKIFSFFPTENVIVVTHGGVIKLLMRHSHYPYTLVAGDDQIGNLSVYDFKVE
jgi:broad specificity phosphatase PhoE